MSNLINDLILEQANEFVENEWCIISRQDLQDHCKEYVFNYCIEHEGVVTDTVMFRGMIEYLSSQSSDTISSKDIDEMAKESIC